MPTSGTSTFNFNRDQIIKSALRKIGVIAAGETPGAQTVQDAADALNIMIKAWDASGLHIWTEEEATLFLQPNQNAYVLGGATTDHAAWTSYTYTTLGVAAANGATSISVASISGIANANRIGVGLDRGTIAWTTVNGTPSGTTVALASGLTDSASVGNPVYVYTTDVQRPLRVVAGRRFNFPSGIDTEMIPVSRLDYRALPNKLATGTVTQFFYDPRGGANTQGILYVWPTPTVSTDGVKFTWYRSIQDFNAAGNLPDLPNEWLDAVIWTLALKLAPEYDVPPQRFAMVKQQSDEALTLAMGWDREVEAVYFGVNFDQR